MRKETEIQEIENLISESLNSDKPSKSVVNAAKQLMVEEKLNKNKTEKIITKKRWSLVGVYSCIAVMLIMVCCLPFILKQPEQIIEDNEFLTENIVSIEQYNQNADTRIAYLDFDIVQSTIYSEYLEEERIDIYIKEVYSNNRNSIELYVLLNETQKDIVDIKKYTSFTDSELLNDILVEYKIEDESCYAKFSYRGYTYMLSCEANTTVMLSYITSLTED